MTVLLHKCTKWCAPRQGQAEQLSNSKNKFHHTGAHYLVNLCIGPFIKDIFNGGGVDGNCLILSKIPDILQMSFINCPYQSLPIHIMILRLLSAGWLSQPTLVGGAPDDPSRNLSLMLVRKIRHL